MQYRKSLRKRKENNVNKFNSEIRSITAREILDSRGNPTVETVVVLESGARGSASVPSGASTGIYEATELRDGDMTRYGGRGVRLAVESVNSKIAPTLVGVSALDSVRVDSIMITLDGTQNKSNLGANAILSVSLAVCRAAAAHLGIPLYRYIGGYSVNTLPIPMMNILNGGAHSDNNIDIQEFMIVPVGAANFTEAVRMGAETYASLKKLLSDKKLSTAIGDEGGFAPMLAGDEVAIELLTEAIKKSGYRPGVDISLALDVASSEWYKADEGKYFLPKRGKELNGADLTDYIATLVESYPVISVEDGVGEDDILSWRTLTKRLGERTMLVGDDLFVTNRSRLEMGIKEGIANSVLIKPNQIGTVSEVCETVELAKAHGYKTVMSHRSGETADTSIADLAVALRTEYIKTGAPARGERVAKYNRLMEIENELFSPAYASEWL